jgi:hypothetical protein
MKNILALIALAAILPIASFAQQAGSISLDDLIPKDQQQRMGIQKLTGEEKEALRQHILALVTAACAQANRSSESPKVSEPSPKQPATPQRGNTLKTYAATGGGCRVERTDEG